jgi:RNA polymerase sigma factor (sigma-70 family)
VAAERTPAPAIAPLDVAARELAPRVLGALLRRHGGLDACEDAVQEALTAAAQQWPPAGVPDNPFGWLYAVASRRLIDEIRSGAARRAREVADARSAPDPVAGLDGGPAALPPAPEHDDSLDVLLLCCHPALSPPAQIALALRAVAGLSTAQIAAAFFTSETTMAQRITRAKAAVRAAGTTFPPPAADRPARLAAAAHVVYLLFNEGYVRSAGDEVADPLLATEAIRLARMAHRLEPGDGEITALLALLLLTHARLPARTDAAGRIVPLQEQDRGRWDRALVAEGEALTEQALRLGPPGAFALQAAIAAVHAGAPSADRTDWAQVAELYALLERVAPGPMVTVSRAIAVGEADGAAAGLALLDAAAADPRLADHHRFLAARAHLRERLGDDPAAAGADWARAAELTANARERAYLQERAARAGQPPRR